MFNLQDYTRNYNSQKNFGIVSDESTVKQLQQISMNIYIDVLDVCKRHGLVIMLGGGSALGAVRHGGFIPWDDDMDFMMPRADYDKFMEIFDQELGGKYELISPKCGYGVFVKVSKPDTKLIGLFQNPKCFHPGVSIDINALDYVPDNAVAYYVKGMIANSIFFLINSRKMYVNATPTARRFLTQTFSGAIFYYFRLFLGFLISWIPARTMCAFFDRFISSSVATKRISIPSGRRHYFGETLPAEVFIPVKRNDFDGVEAYIPNDCDRYLKNLYGNTYMEIPPIEKREYHAYTDIQL